MATQDRKHIIVIEVAKINQDKTFDLGADYTAEMIHKEKQAVYDAGLTSWTLWDPANKYTWGAVGFRHRTWFTHIHFEIL